MDPARAVVWLEPLEVTGDGEALLFDYAMVGRVDLMQDGKRASFEARTDTAIGMKWLSMGQIQDLETEAIKQSKQALFRQLIEILSKQ